MNKAFLPLPIFFFSILCCMLSLFMYDMPHENWVALGKAIAFVWTNGKCIVAIVLLLFFLRFMLRPVESATEQIYEPEPDIFPEAQAVEMKDGNVAIKARGRYFIFRHEGKRASVQEYSRGGKPVSGKVYNADNCWRFGKSPDESIAEYLRDKVRSDEHLPPL